MKNLDKYSIAVFGDSIVRGLFLKDGHVERTTVNAVHLIEQQYNIEICNHSAFGQTLKRFCGKNDLNNFLSSDTPNKQKLAVICLGGNDADHNWKAISCEPTANHTSQTDLGEFSRLLADCVAKIRQSGAVAIIATILPVDSQRYFHNVIAKNFDGNAVLQFFHNDVSNINRCQERFNSAILTVAAKHNCHLLDLREKFLSRTDFLDFFCDDGIHPNDRGQRLMADTIINFIEDFDVTTLFSN